MTRAALSAAHPWEEIGTFPEVEPWEVEDPPSSAPAPLHPELLRPPVDPTQAILRALEAAPAPVLALARRLAQRAVSDDRSWLEIYAPRRGPPRTGRPS